MFQKQCRRRRDAYPIYRWLVNLRIDIWMIGSVFNPSVLRTAPLCRGAITSRTHISTMSKNFHTIKILQRFPSFLQGGGRGWFFYSLQFPDSGWFLPSFPFLPECLYLLLVKISYHKDFAIIPFLQACRQSGALSPVRAG